MKERKLMTKVQKNSDGEELHLVYGEVYAPNIPDSQGDYMTEETIRVAAHKFMANLRNDRVDTSHNNIANGAVIVESFIAREGDPDFIPGSWVVGVYIEDDELWKMVKTGEINGFSLEAVAETEEKIVLVDFPPIVTGFTSENDGHRHRFYVTYNSEGEFLGGTTDEVDGHKHEIKRGVVTEITRGHSHRFASLDGEGWIIAE